MKYSTLILAWTIGAFLAVSNVVPHSHHHKPCPKNKAIGTVMALQQRFQRLTQQCNYQDLLKMSISSASYSSIDFSCATSCCVDVGDMPTWWTHYECSDNIEYTQEPNSVVVLKNGTVIYSTQEFTARADKSMYGYYMNYYWFPVGYCEYKVGYITANAMNCAAYIPGLLNCADCP